MIVGIGTDITEIERIREALDRSGDRLLARVLTKQELKLLEGMADPVITVAGRWAAKEAVAKALGTGFGAECTWQDVEILRNPQGAPFVTLHGLGAQTAANLGIARIHVSISHERSYAIAYAVAESAS